MLDDGTYDVIVVDAVVVDAESASEEASLRLDLTILAGPRKGEMVSMRAIGLAVDDIEALGLPGTLTVREGEPSVVLDR